MPILKVILFEGYKQYSDLLETGYSTKTETGQVTTHTAYYDLKPEQIAEVNEFLRRYKSNSREAC